MRAKKIVPFLGVALMSLSACTSTSATPATQPSALVARVMSHCTDIAAPELGPGTLCIDNGFRMKRDDFSFANYGRSPRADDNVTAQTLIDLLGYDTVCIPGPTNECVVRPTAVQLLESWNTALAGGRCEGLAALSARLYMSLDEPQQFSQAANRTSDLSSRDPDVAEAVVYWWATQLIDEVKRAASDSRLKSPLQLVDELIQGLSHKLGYTLGLYFESQGHAVTPFAVTQRDDFFIIHAYDNNFPGKRREILVSKITNTWTYLGASTGVDGTAIDWTGAKESFELTSMSSRQGPFTCPFCRVPNEDTPTVISLASRDAQQPGFLRVTSRQGVAEMTPSGFTATIKDAAFSVSKGAGGLATLTLPPSVVDFDIEVTRRSTDVPSGDVVMSVEKPGFARLQLAGNLATHAWNETSLPVISARKADITVLAPPLQSISVSIARNGTLARKQLDAAEEFHISRISDQSITISVKGVSVDSTATLPISASDISEHVDIAMNNNELVLTSATPTSVRARKARTANFIPRQRQSPRSTTTSTTVASIEISEPD
jgi:hypothetical protein